jgi:superoxide dismutase, Fe-Mn family
MHRRSLLKGIGLTAVGCLAVPGLKAVAEQPQQPGASPGPFSLPSLPYDYDALEPYIDAETMHLHHDKHHAAYVKNLNTALASAPELAKLSVEDLIRQLDRVPPDIRTAVRNNGGGHANHSFFWRIMQKNAPDQPTGELARSIGAKFGSFANFQDQFTKAALSVFGSGWSWLSVNEKRELNIETTPNQDSPWMSGRSVLLGIDVWEHAYYLKYQNRRADYVNAFYKVISWNAVAENFRQAGKP